MMQQTHYSNQSKMNIWHYRAHREYFPYRLAIILVFAGFLFPGISASQSIGDEKRELTNYLKRLYVSNPFEGVKILDDYEKQYLISIVKIDLAKYKDESIINRVALIKAQSQANNFVNGAEISSEMIISTQTIEKEGQNEYITNSFEKIRQNSTGFISGLENLVSMDESGKFRIFVFGAVIK